MLVNSFKNIKKWTNIYSFQLKEEFEFSAHTEYYLSIEFSEKTQSSFAQLVAYCLIW
jgi:hypothetical protein